MSFTRRGQHVSGQPLADAGPHFRPTWSCESLSPRQQKILMLRALRPSNEQAGGVMGISAGAVRVATHRARQKRRAEEQSSAKKRRDVE